MMRRLTFSLDTWQGPSMSADALRSSTSSTSDRVSLQEGRPQCYSTNVPAALLNQQSDLIDQLMGFAYTLGARRLEVYVRDAE
jgi:hypothetical protein